MYTKFTAFRNSIVFIAFFMFALSCGDPQGRSLLFDAESKQKSVCQSRAALGIDMLPQLPELEKRGLKAQIDDFMAHNKGKSIAPKEGEEYLKIPEVEKISGYLFGDSSVIKIKPSESIDATVIDRDRFVLGVRPKFLADFAADCPHSAKEMKYMVLAHEMGHIIEEWDVKLHAFKRFNPFTAFDEARSRANQPIKEFAFNQAVLHARTDLIGLMILSRLNVDLEKVSTFFYWGTHYITSHPEQLGVKVLPKPYRYYDIAVRLKMFKAYK